MGFVIVKSIIQRHLNHFNLEQWKKLFQIKGFQAVDLLQYVYESLLFLKKQLIRENFHYFQKQRKSSKQPTITDHYPASTVFNPRLVFFHRYLAPYSHYFDRNITHQSHHLIYRYLSLSLKNSHNVQMELLWGAVPSPGNK